MELRQLRYFAAIINEGNISKAAKALNLSQPPLSMQIRQLEEELGCTLLERSTRSVRLTEAGQILYRRAVTILGLCASAKTELQDFQSGVAGTLHIGTVSSVGSTVFTSWLLSFHQCYPKVNYALCEANTYELIEKVRSGQIELALVRTPFNAPDLDCVSLAEETMIAAGSAEFLPQAAPEGMELADLADVPLILYRRWEQILRDEFERADRRPRIVCINDDARTTVCLAEAGLGVGIVPASVLPIISAKNMRVCPLNNAGLKTRLSVIFRKGAALSAAARAFVQSIAGRENAPEELIL